MSFLFYVYVIKFTTYKLVSSTNNSIQRMDNKLTQGYIYILKKFTFKFFLVCILKGLKNNKLLVLIIYNTTFFK